MGVYLVIEAAMLHKRVPLGHDEAIYLLRARAFADGLGSSKLDYWAPYRAPGLPFLMSVPMRVMGESVTVSRGIVVLIGAGVVVLTALLVKRLAGTTAALFAPWLVVLTSAHVSYASLILLDVPALFFALVTVLVLEHSTRAGRVTWFPALLLPVGCLIATYVRFGASTVLAAGFAAVLFSRADLLLERTHRLTNLLRLAVVGVACAGASAAVVLVPWMTGSEVAPIQLQHSRQVDKGLSGWSSYRDMIDIWWPDGSRSGEAFSWVALAVIVVGVALTGIAAWRGHGRRAAVAGAVAVLVWVVGLNAALAQLFGNYVGLGTAFVVLLAAPGWGWAYQHTVVVPAAQRVFLVAACSIAVVGSALAYHAAANQVGQQGVYELYRASGVRLDEVSVNGRCGVMTSYVQIAWYSDCHLVTFVDGSDRVAPGTFRTEVSLDLFPARHVDADEIFVAVANRGKRQPTGGELEDLLLGGELLSTIDHPTRAVQVWHFGADD